MKWENDEIISIEHARRVGKLKHELKSLTVSVAVSCKIALILAIHDNAGDVKAGAKQAWDTLRDALSLRDYKGTKDNPLTDAEKQSATTYNTFHKSLERACTMFASYKHGSVEVLPVLDFALVMRDAEYNGSIDMNVALVNLDSEAKRRAALASKRIESLRENEQVEASRAAKQQFDAEVAKAVQAQLDAMKPASKKAANG
ncbi:MAG: hypothetical protein E6R03_03565 [Hyphomicrobiaceae bacterium]|nr:MAG: hypothetical protein E6R03_03565 [Hyphomicrobiaceae bacterium]